MVNAINHDVQNVRCQDPICPHNRQIGLSLPAEPDRSFAFFAAYPLRKRGIFNDNLQNVEIHVRIESRSCRTMGMLKEIRRERKKSAERSNVRLARSR